MSKNWRLQIPLDNKIKKSLEKKATEEGFSSSNDLVRLLIHKFLNGDFRLTLVPHASALVDLETERRIYQSLKEIKQGDYDLIDFDKDSKALNKLCKD